MKALCDCGGINEESAAQGTADVWIELVEGELRLQKSKQISNQIFFFSFKILESLEVAFASKTKQKAILPTLQLVNISVL